MTIPSNIFLKAFAKDRACSVNNTAVRIQQKFSWIMTMRSALVMKNAQSNYAVGWLMQKKPEYLIASHCPN
ncbi:hypothetical protein [Candidatus Methylobacter favarea]|uniref:hypothetical protein n=1 Tax=Candidatus Methylobacter favarea TaxID=2707345 RepID=UPI00157C1588|nr:hypothetical protein [Candidatus Methylobacter favarea]